jgi:hypothetical protein
MKGKVEQVSQRKTAKGGDVFGLRIADTWYNGWGEAPAQEGDVVEFEFETKGEFSNIKGDVKVVTMEQPKLSQRDEQIMRQSAVKQAVERAASDEKYRDEKHFWNLVQQYEYYFKTGEFIPMFETASGEAVVEEVK